MSIILKRFKKTFRAEEEPENVKLADLDIVKLSVISWIYRNDLTSKKTFTWATLFLSLLVIVIQAGVLIWLSLDVTDILFCGDVVRHVNRGADPIELFFNG